MEVPARFLPEWTGQAVMVDPTYYLFPFASLAPNDWDDPAQARNGLDYVYRLAGQFGLRPYGFLEVPGQMAGVLGEGPGDVATLFPQTGALQGLTAMAREAGVAPWVPPGGIYAEQPLRHPPTGFVAATDDSVAQSFGQRPRDAVAERRHQVNPQ